MELIQRNEMVMIKFFGQLAINFTEIMGFIAYRLMVSQNFI